MSAPLIVLIDDDFSVRRALARLLRVWGYAVQTFGTVEAFTHRSEDHRPACLILDVRMPGQTGLDLFASLQASGSGVPVIFITGHGDVPMAAHARDHGAVAFLTKPFSDRELLDAIHRALADQA